MVYDNGTNEYVYYYITDLQGNVVSIVSRYMNVVAYYSYDAWGNVISTTNGSGTPVTSGTTIAFVNPILYRGYYYDRETSLYYLHTRYYDPAVGRFLNADGFTSTGTGFLGYNMYAYCENNPVISKDSSGNWPVKNTMTNMTDRGGSKVIKYPVPMYYQDDLQICWAFSQIMIVDFRNKTDKTQEEATDAAIDLAKSITDDNELRDNPNAWNRGSMPTNITGDWRNFGEDYEFLYSALKTCGPLYAIYADESMSFSHITVITGINLTTGLVFSNDPTLGSLAESYSGFKTKTAYFAGTPLMLNFIGICDIINN